MRNYGINYGKNSRNCRKGNCSSRITCRSSRIYKNSRNCRRIITSSEEE